MKRWPEIAYMSWAKAPPAARTNLARSGLDPCPLALLHFDFRRLASSLPAGYGWQPLREALGERYRVAADRVLPLSGGASLANFVAVAAALDGAGSDAEVILEQPAYEPLRRVPEALGARLRRLPRRFAAGWAIDLERFAALVNPRTRLAIVSNLHNPSGAPLDDATLTVMAERLARVGACLLVDEVYGETRWDRPFTSAVGCGPNVLATSSLTKAFGLDGLRAGWILGPRPLVARAGKLNDLLGVNGVAAGEQLTLAALRRLPEIRRRARAILEPNLDRARRFFAREDRLAVHVPPGGNVLFPRLPAGLDGRRFGAHLLARYSTLVVDGRFFEAPRHVRLGLGVPPARLARGFANLSRALDDLVGPTARPQSIAHAAHGCIRCHRGCSAPQTWVPPIAPAARAAG